MVTGVRLVDKLQHKRTPHVRIEVAIHFGDQDAASVGCSWLRKWNIFILS